MDERRAKGLSKFMSLLLRHRPQVAGLTLDEAGWVPVNDLLAGIQKQAQWTDVTHDEIDHVVATNNKKRFEFSEDGISIRASQGHSVKVELGYAAQKPPEFLYHGTASKFIRNIQQQGLRKRQRHHVHMSLDVDTAKNVGGRHGRPVVLTIWAEGMASEGHEFFVSENGVWLTDHVPPEFIEFP